MAYKIDRKVYRESVASHETLEVPVEPEESENDKRFLSKTVPLPHKALLPRERNWSEVADHSYDEPDEEYYEEEYEDEYEENEEEVNGEEGNDSFEGLYYPSDVSDDTEEEIDPAYVSYLAKKKWVPSDQAMGMSELPLDFHYHMTSSPKHKFKYLELPMKRPSELNQPPKFLITPERFIEDMHNISAVESSPVQKLPGWAHRAMKAQAAQKYRPPKRAASPRSPVYQTPAAYDSEDDENFETPMGTPGTVGKGRRRSLAKLAVLRNAFGKIHEKLTSPLFTVQEVSRHVSADGSTIEKKSKIVSGRDQEKVKEQFLNM